MLFRVLVSVALAAALATGCENSTPGKGDESVQSKSDRVGDWIAKLKSSHENKKREARTQIMVEADSLTPQDGTRLITAVAKGLPDADEDGILSPVFAILNALAVSRSPAFIEPLKGCFKKIPETHRGTLLGVLSVIGTKESATAFMELAALNPRALDNPSSVAFLQSEVSHPEIYWPDLLHLAQVGRNAGDIHLAALQACQAGALPEDMWAKETPALLAALDKMLEAYQTAKATSGAGWRDSEVAQAHRREAGILLDLFHCLPIEDIEARLTSLLANDDARLVHFAATLLLERGRDVPADAWTTIAASAEMRNWLHKALEEQKRLDLFPKAYRTQAAFAESELVDWLTYPTELGRVPDNIELMKVAPYDTKGPDGVFDTYLFRFRCEKPAKCAEDGWMAGVAGPYRRDDAPSHVSYGGTFSKFEAWDAKSPDEHIEDIAELMKNLEERQ